MLRLVGGQVESLFDGLLPVEVRELPEDLAVLDRLLGDRLVLAPIERAWSRPPAIMVAQRFRWPASCG